MQYFRTRKSIIAWVSVLLMFFTQIAPLQAAIVGNESLMSDITRADLIKSLDKAEVQNLLISKGVDPEAAKLRIQQMNDDELASLQQNFQQLPAGAGGLGTVAFIFVVLLITDMIGATDIFPFVKKVE
jgi:hypothetical protein